QTGDEAKALKDALNVFNARFSLQRVDNRPDPRLVHVTPPQWEKLESIFKQYKFVEGTVPAAELYTAALIDQINKFDRAAIGEQAKSYRPWRRWWWVSRGLCAGRGRGDSLPRPR